MIALEGVSKAFGQHHVLSDLSFEIGERERLAIIGESGTGKSTLGKLLLGLIRPSAGRYRFDGQDVAALRGESLRRWRWSVQAVFQNPALSLDPRMRIRDLITEPLVVRGGLGRSQLLASAGEGLEMVGLPTSMLDRYPHQLSGGQRQRVAIARAMSVHPRLLVLDEPLSALDMSVRAQVLRLLERLVDERGITVVFITHDISTMWQLCDRAIVLHGGRVVEDAPSRPLIDAPRHPYSDLLVTAVRRLGEPEPPPALDSAGSGGCSFAARCPIAKERCVAEAPELRIVGEHRLARCHFA